MEVFAIQHVSMGRREMFGCLEALLQLVGKHEVTWLMSWHMGEISTCSATRHLAVCSFTSVVKFSNPQQK